MAKIAFLLFSGPEMPCKLQHAFIFARDIVARDGEARILFEGNAPKWLPDLARPEHQMAKLFATAREQGLIAGVCRGCAQVHGVLDAAVALGLPLLADASGHVSLMPYLQRGYEIITL